MRPRNSGRAVSTCHLKPATTLRGSDEAMLRGVGRGVVSGLHQSSRPLRFDLACASRCLASQSGGPRRGGHRGESRKKHNFWAKWAGKTQQAFWQDVAFSQDRAHEERNRPSLLKPSIEDKHSNLSSMHRQQDLLESAEREEYDDIYYGAADPWDEEFEEYYDEEDEAGAEGMDEYRERTAQRKRALAQSLYADEGIDSRRRAELMSLIEDLGEDSLEPPPVMPFESDDVGGGDAGIQALVKEQQQRRRARVAISLRLVSGGARH